MEQLKSYVSNSDMRRMSGEKKELRERPDEESRASKRTGIISKGKEATPEKLKEVYLPP